MAPAFALRHFTFPSFVHIAGSHGRPKVDSFFSLCFTLFFPFKVVLWESYLFFLP